jgi:FkbH-like protein
VVERQLNTLERFLTGAGASGTVALALPSVATAPVEPIPRWQYGGLQSQLDALVHSFAARLSTSRHVRLLNPAYLDGLSAALERGDVKTSNQAGYPYQLPHTDALASALSQLLLPPAPRKGIITDLDNTFWSGILGEVGTEGVAWDLDHHAAHYGAYQQVLQSLADSGVLVAIASKNDPALVTSALERPDILVRAASVFPVEVHWRPKSESVGRILKAWNISADSVVFIDDSALELAEVKNAHPTLDCRQFHGNDPNQVASLIYELVDLFGKPFDSEEDALRLQSLRAGAVFDAGSDGTGSLEEVLAGAEGVLQIIPVQDPPDPRALELVNKTNQFNLNGQRYKEADWLQYVKDPARVVWMASYTDRFGPLGKISVLAGRRVGDRELELDAWVLSCRAFARRIEFAMLDALFARQGIEKIRFRFEATERNGPLQEVLKRLCPTDGSTEDWSLDRAGFEQRKLAWHMRVEYPL